MAGRMDDMADLLEVRGNEDGPPIKKRPQKKPLYQAPVDKLGHRIGVKQRPSTAKRKAAPSAVPQTYQDQGPNMRVEMKQRQPQAHHVGARGPTTARDIYDEYSSKTQAPARRPERALHHQAAPGAEPAGEDGALLQEFLEKVLPELNEKYGDVRKSAVGPDDEAWQLFLKFQDFMSCLRTTTDKYAAFTVVDGVEHCLCGDCAPSVETMKGRLAEPVKCSCSKCQSSFATLFKGCRFLCPNCALERGQCQDVACEEPLDKAPQGRNAHHMQHAEQASSGPQQQTQAHHDWSQAGAHRQEPQRPNMEPKTGAGVWFKENFNQFHDAVKETRAMMGSPEKTPVARHAQNPEDNPQRPGTSGGKESRSQEGSRPRSAGRREGGSRRRSIDEDSEEEDDAEPRDPFAPILPDDQKRHTQRILRENQKLQERRMEAETRKSAEVEKSIMSPTRNLPAQMSNNAFRVKKAQRRGHPMEEEAARFKKELQDIQDDVQHLSMLTEQRRRQLESMDGRPVTAGSGGPMGTSMDASAARGHLGESTMMTTPRQELFPAGQPPSPNSPVDNKDPWFTQPPYHSIARNAPPMQLQDDDLPEGHVPMRQVDHTEIVSGNIPSFVDHLRSDIVQSPIAQRYADGAPPVHLAPHRVSQEMIKMAEGEPSKLNPPDDIEVMDRKINKLKEITDGRKRLEPPQKNQLVLESYESFLDQLRRKEMELIDKKRQMELERVRGPKPGWYALKDKTFSQEMQRYFSTNNVPQEYVEGLKSPVAL